MVALFAMLGLAYWRSLQVPVRYALGNVPRSDFMRGFERPAGLSRFSLRANEEVAEFLRHRTAIDAPIFVWGFQPLIYYLAERVPASRFIFSVPLVTDWSPAEWRGELIRDLEQLLRRDYRPAKRIEGFDIWAWRNGTQSDR